MGQARDRALRLYDVTAARTSANVLAVYSTSFGLGTRLLGRRAQQDIRAVYALVRLADEVVDTYRGDDAGAELDELETQTHRALRTGYSTNLVVHAFARTARRVGITQAETVPFYASMRADLTVHSHDRASYEAYVFGSAEVVGLMCVRAFLNEPRRPGDPVVEPTSTQVAGARALGAAFQKINFLRDLGIDNAELDRTYFPGTRPGVVSSEQLTEILEEIADDVAVARSALPELPPRARYAVAATLALYQRLLDDLAQCTPAQILDRRVRLSTPTKLLVVGEAVVAQARAGR
ncbi:phytoene/squalene synthase family protein [Cellulomonas sp. McL0617]|uniref:phytoene/squalene synthase family protein n=1 Tax=Cellulomonas sp. McL0617 TaxID=3415675 RepID=UPI003CE67A75